MMPRYCIESEGFAAAWAFKEGRVDCNEVQATRTVGASTWRGRDYLMHWREEGFRMRVCKTLVFLGRIASSGKGGVASSDIGSHDSRCLEHKNALYHLSIYMIHCRVRNARRRGFSYLSSLTAMLKRLQVSFAQNTAPALPTIGGADPQFFQQSIPNFNVAICKRDTVILRTIRHHVAFPLK